MRSPSFGRAIALVTGASLLVPVVGLATAPVLAHSLGVVGRGQTGAALAPNLLIVGGATLGLPQAITYVVAKEPWRSHVALAWAALFALATGCTFIVLTSVLSPYLADGDVALSGLISLAAYLAIPALLVGLLRGAAIGKQNYGAVALDRVMQSVIKLVVIVGLAVTSHLTVLTAVLVMATAPILSGLVYLPALFRPAPRDDTASQSLTKPTWYELLRFGSQEWMGSVAVMLMARVSQLLVTPLSDVAQLGLLLVAVTISDLPYLVTQTIRDVAFGASSADENTHRLTSTSRITLALASVSAVLLGGTLPWWISVAFGSDFVGAVVPTWLLLLSSAVAVPGLIAGAGLDATGRPGRRSLSLVLALLVNVAGIIILTPTFGATGAACAALASTLLSSTLMVYMASRLLQVKRRDFVIATWDDWKIARSILDGRGWRRPPERSQSEDQETIP